MSRVILVRHALSAVDPDIDSKRWGLADGAPDDCVRLADALGLRPAVIYASDEQKAVDTASAVAQRVGGAVRIDARFGEVERPFTHGDYRSLAARYLHGGEAEGWEPRDAVLERFSSALSDGEEATDDAIVVVNHGLAMSLHVASVVDVDVVAFWTALTFPDAWALDASTGELRRVFTEGRRPGDQT